MESLNPSLFPLDSCPPVSNEEFNLFHSIDRELFTRLIHNLGREPSESMQVMALWMWLEKQSSDMNFIKRLLSLPPVLLNELADEGVECLKCAEDDQYPFGDGNSKPNELALLPDLLSTRGVGLGFFHENRIAVLRGVTKIVTTVCARAFSDILKHAREASNVAMAPNVVGGGNVVPAGAVAPQVQFVGSIREAGESSRTGENRNLGGGGGVGGVMVVPPPPPPPHGVPIFYQYPYFSVPFIPLPHHPPPIEMVPVHMVYDLGTQRQMLTGNELGEMFSQNLSISEQVTNDNVTNVLEEEEEVSADDRTIFLTFSKGYPISEDEVREFFTKRFGDFIEELIMQEVEGEEQVLYARMVARSSGVIEGIVGRNKAKYSINGKHVWARKYVKKQNLRSSPPRSGGAGGGEFSSSSQHHQI